MSNSGISASDFNRAFDGMVQQLNRWTCEETAESNDAATWSVIRRRKPGGYIRCNGCRYIMLVDNEQTYKALMGNEMQCELCGARLQK